MSTNQGAVIRSLTPTEFEAHNAALIEQGRAQLVDEEIRSEPLLRIALVEIIGELAPIVKKHAAQIAQVASGQSGVFETEEVIDLLTFKLAEFFVHGNIEHTAPSEPALRGWQLTADHAADWESVRIMPDGSFSILEMYT